MKFGGTSVGKPERMHQVSQLITRDAEPTIVVLSALSGTTNALVEIGNSISTGDRELAHQQIGKLKAHYQSFIKDLVKGEKTLAKAASIVDEHFEFLTIILKISFSEALNKDILAQGELLSTKVVQRLSRGEGHRPCAAAGAGIYEHRYSRRTAGAGYQNKAEQAPAGI